MTALADSLTMPDARTAARVLGARGGKAGGALGGRSRSSAKVAVAQRNVAKAREARRKKREQTHD